MTELTTRDVAEMEYSDLRAEYDELQERLYFGPSIDDSAEEDGYHDRMKRIWAEFKRRSDVKQPQCPTCDARQWGQTPGNPKQCIACGLILGHARDDLDEEITEAWNAILARPNGGETA